MSLETSPETSQQSANTQETSQETSPQETSQATTDEAAAQAQSQQKTEHQQASTSRRTQGDRIAELENKLARMEAIYQLQGQNVVDTEVCADLLLKGYTIEQLKQSKPYLFQSNTQSATQTAPLGLVRQPQKVVAETQTPKQPVSSNISSESFVKTLANMLTSKF